LQIFGGNIEKAADNLENPGVLETSEVKPAVNSGNRFSLMVYATEDTTVEITRDIKLQLVSGTVSIPTSWEVGSGWASKGAMPGGFVFEGENIKSVHYESRNGEFFNLKWFDLSLPPSKAVETQLSDDIITVTITLDEGEVCPYEQARKPVNPVYLEGDDILDPHISGNMIWRPAKLIATRLSGDYEQYLSDIITITVTFDDGEVMTQIVEITLEEVSEQQKQKQIDELLDAVDDGILEASFAQNAIGFIKATVDYEIFAQIIG